MTKRLAERTRGTHKPKRARGFPAAEAERDGCKSAGAHSGRRAFYAEDVVLLINNCFKSILPSHWRHNMRAAYYICGSKDT